MRTAFASRAVLSKATMDKPVGENMGAANLYGILTIIAFTLSLPFAVYYEGSGFSAAWKTSTAIVGAPWLVRQMVLDGFYYYTYNEVAFITLNQVAPVTHSIANTIKVSSRTRTCLHCPLSCMLALSPMCDLSPLSACASSWPRSSSSGTSSRPLEQSALPSRVGARSFIRSQRPSTSKRSPRGGTLALTTLTWVPGLA